MSRSGILAGHLLAGVAGPGSGTTHRVRGLMAQAPGGRRGTSSPGEDLMPTRLLRHLARATSAACIAVVTVVTVVTVATVVPVAGHAQGRTVPGTWAEEFHLDGPAAPTCIETLGDRVVVGGWFRTAGPVLARHLAWYDADGWHAFDAVPGRGVHDLFPHAGSLAAMTRWSPYPGDVDTTQIWTLAGDA